MMVVIDCSKGENQRKIIKVTTIKHDLRDTLVGVEVEIYALLCQNMGNQQICDKLNLSVYTVKWHLRRIYEKLGVQARDSGDLQSARRRAILYSGTTIEQTYSREDKTEKSFSLKEIKTAAKKIGCNSRQISDLISFLEMEDE